MGRGMLPGKAYRAAKNRALPRVNNRDIGGKSMSAFRARSKRHLSRVNGILAARCYSLIQRKTCNATDATYATQEQTPFLSLRY